MSTSLMVSIMHTKLLITSCQHHVLLCLACHAHDGQLGACFPSLNTIAKICRRSKPTVIAALKQLEFMGLISIEKRPKKDGNYKSNYYTIHNDLIISFKKGGIKYT